ncbi:hypothetical protein [Humibacter sp. RRB41]|uniref:hypothetical protein n=1 Tax=Humibacter sp. RRB41 TaxID=2919946 RepID=UPI001FAAAE5A|nr:hypothetical protein [Humibacter sp. RRB41]
MTTATTEERPATFAAALRNLYYVRFGFAIIWAVLVAFTASTIGPFSAVLLVLYPAFDLVAAIVDHRASRATASAPLLFVNMGLSLLAAIALGFAVTAGVTAVLVVWGIWAVTAGAVQLIVAITRYRLGAQWPMILSGGISVLAGVGFMLMSAGSTSLVGPAGYATLGGIFFLISAIRLQRSAKRDATA